MNAPCAQRVDLLGLLVDTRVNLLELSVNTGLELLKLMLEEDRKRLCGRKGSPDPDRQATRYGYDDGSVVLGGRRVAVRKPRVRSVAGEEIPLPTYRHFNREDPLAGRALEQMILGVSTRNFSRSLEPLPQEAEEQAVRRSSVSRRFVARTESQLERFLSRPLGERDFPMLMLDGKGFGDHTLVIALGIDAEGHKEVLGVAEGSTENEAVCRRLLANLVDRGLSVERARLFVIDGGKGLRKAIRGIFGDWARVHRCHLHKIRNVEDHLPEAKRIWAKAAMRKAYASETPALARRRLLDLARSLADHPGAVGSLREGLEETLTLLHLGVRGALARSLASTNPIENLMDTLERVGRNVKRWRHGRMALRWAVTGVVEAQKGFRRVKGYREIPALLRALESHVTSRKVDGRTEHVA
ncbi:MAG TPA: IS256 family transposase [Nitrospira sp.]|nr:IS256 family transposase [Nitrospira sp.]